MKIRIIAGVYYVDLENMTNRRQKKTTTNIKQKRKHRKTRKAHMQKNNGEKFEKMNPTDFDLDIVKHTICHCMIFEKALASIEYLRLTKF